MTRRRRRHQSARIRPVLRETREVHVRAAQQHGAMWRRAIGRAGRATRRANLLGDRASSGVRIDNNSFSCGGLYAVAHAMLAAAWILVPRIVIGCLQYTVRSSRRTLSGRQRWWRFLLIG